MSNLLHLQSNQKKNTGNNVTVGGSRHGRLARRDTNEDLQLDFKQDTKTLVGEILTNVSRRHGLTKGRRLAYLNAFVKVLQHSSSQSTGRNLGYSVEEICLCLRVCLVDEATVVRMAAIRVFRYLVTTEEDLIALNSCGIPFLLVRSLDIVLNNSGERMQATRLCQKILGIPNGAVHFSASLTHALVSVAFDGLQEHDKLHRASLSVLCQLALLNPIAFIECGGVRVLLHNVLETSSPMVLEAMVGSLLHLLNVPTTRDAAGVNLHCLVAPLTDPHFKHAGHENPDKDIDERELGYRCAKQAIGTVLRSWSGLAHFCQSRHSGIQALIDALYIEQLEIRRTILDLLCEIVGLKFPTWTDEVSVAMSAVDASHPRDSWRLQEGFVVQEALSILPHLAVSTPNVTANHMALLVYSLAGKGLLEALVEVIVTSDTFISVRATVLLGELLSLVDRFVPLDCFDPSQCIPSLIRVASVGPERRHVPTGSAFSSSVTQDFREQRAMEAVSVLSALQKLKARPPLPHSVFLQTQLIFAGCPTKRHDKFVDRLGQVQLSRVLRKDLEGNPSKLLKETGVLNSKDPSTWQWEIILTLVKWCPLSLKRVDDSTWRTFLRRLIDFFKPSNNLFNRIELGKENAILYSRVGCSLMEFLAEEVQNFSGITLLEELLADIASLLDDLLQHTKNPYVCTFSPNKMESTLAQTYFLFIGKLTQSNKGIKILEQGHILRRFYDLVCEMKHDCYTKLIVSSLCYREEYCKRILNAALSSRSEGSRLYATQFLRVLVRTRFPGFSKWGIELLVNQLEDTNKAISLTALDILEEAIHDKMFLESLIALRPTLSHLGDRGLLLLVCFLSLPSGFKFLLEANFLKNEIDKWRTAFNKRYVELVEVLVRDTVSTLRRGEDGKYPERASRNQEQSRFVDIYVPPHLYGQLARHKEGLEILLERGDVDRLMVTVTGCKCTTPEETRELKAALWALGHLATSIDSLPLLEEARIFETMIHLAENCPVLSVRHTVFHCLCLVSCTEPGAEALRKWGWYAVPRNHHELYPIWGFTTEVSPKGPEMADLDIELEELEKASITSRTDTFSNLPVEEEDADSVRFFMMDEESVVEVETKELPEDIETLVDEVDGESNDTASSRRITYAHGRSQSDSQTLGRPVVTKLTSPVEEDFQFVPPTTTVPKSFKPNAASSPVSSSLGDTIRGRMSNIISSLPTTSFLNRSGSNGSWRRSWRSRSNSVTESTTSGVSSSTDSSMMNRAMFTDRVHTLSPIPSSASIATTTAYSNPGGFTASPSSKNGSRLTLTEPIGRLGSPLYAYRSLRYRKPVIRMPVMSDSDIYPSYSGARRSFIREPKTASLDRHVMLGDLFGESKLMRVNSSVTSLSTPSFRMRPESESKGPCFMGLCLPKHFHMIFLAETHSSRKVSDWSPKGKKDPIKTEPSGSDGDSDKEEEEISEGFEFHSIPTCLGCHKLKEPEAWTQMMIEESHKSLENLTVPEHSADGSRISVVSLGSVSGISGSSSLDSGLKKGIKPGSSEGKTLLRKEVLRLVSSMISCVGAKSNEQGLLRLKQKFPSAFQDLCLYSELCGVLSRYNVRLVLRRFIQELFLDLTFDELYIVASNVLGDSTGLKSLANPESTSAETKCIVQVTLADTSLSEESNKRSDSLGKIMDNLSDPIKGSSFSDRGLRQVSSLGRNPLLHRRLGRELGEETESDLSDYVDLK